MQSAAEKSSALRPANWSGMGKFYSPPDQFAGLEKKVVCCGSLSRDYELVSPPFRNFIVAMSQQQQKKKGGKEKKTGGEAAATTPRPASPAASSTSTAQGSSTPEGGKAVKTKLLVSPDHGGRHIKLEAKRNMVDAEKFLNCFPEQFREIAKKALVLHKEELELDKVYVEHDHLAEKLATRDTAEEKDPDDEKAEKDAIMAALAKAMATMDPNMDHAADIRAWEKLARLDLISVEEWNRLFRGGAKVEDFVGSTEHEAELDKFFHEKNEGQLLVAVNFYAKKLDTNNVASVNNCYLLGKAAYGLKMCQNKKNNNDWDKFCKEKFQRSRSTVNNWIKLYQFVNTYPKFRRSKMAYTTIIKRSAAFSKLMADEPQLSSFWVHME